MRCLRQDDLKPPRLIARRPFAALRVTCREVSMSSACAHDCEETLHCAQGDKGGVSDDLKLPTAHCKGSCGNWMRPWDIWSLLSQKSLQPSLMPALRNWSSPGSLLFLAQDG